jgi:hypothetical protein
MLDIDATALRSAKQALSLANASIDVDTAVFDFSGPFGQRLCDVYLKSLTSARTAAETAAVLSAAPSLALSIFHDVDRVLTIITENLDTMTGAGVMDAR